MSAGSPVEEFGPYLVYEQIGLGGMASVHRAETVGLEGFRRPVALKRMLPHIAGDDMFVKSFVREARLASYLRHSNVAQTYDLGKVGDIYFIAMELITGRNLREILKHGGAVPGGIPLPFALNILNQICDALDYAHNLCDETGQPLGIIHRDVSPSNIIVNDGGVAKLIDFGIAKASAAGMQTMSRTVKGKFGYMAPEYLEGKIDARADLFAIGVIAYELLTSRQLFGGADDMDTLHRVRQMPIEPPSHWKRAIPPEIDSIVMTALERDPDRRWQRATALRTAMTYETKRLGLTMQNAGVVDWIDWAFQQERKDDSDPIISIESGTRPLLDAVTMQRPSAAQPVQPVEPASQSHSLPAPSAPRAPRAERVVAEAPPSRSIGRKVLRVLITIVVLLMITAGIAAVVYFALPYFT